MENWGKSEVYRILEGEAQESRQLRRKKKEISLLSGNGLNGSHEK